MGTQTSVSCHNWHGWNDSGTPFHNGTVQQADFTLICSHCAIAELLQLVKNQKELVIRKIHIRDYRTLPKNPDFLETTRMMLNSTQTIKKGDNNLENKIFSITNIFKRYKIRDLTRPNKLKSTTNKVATRSTKRTWLWKWLHAPSCYSAEHTLLDYIVFFKGGAQCIQDWCQRYSVTT
jgi:hypothetical protein